MVSQTHTDTHSHNWTTLIKGKNIGQPFSFGNEIQHVNERNNVCKLSFIKFGIKSEHYYIGQHHC